MTTVRFKLANGSYFMDWYLDAITTDNDWSNVPSIMGYLGSGLTSVPGVDPRTLTAPDPSPTVGVIANQTDPYDTALGAAGGIVEFQVGDNNMIALGGSDTADAPYLVLYLDSTGRKSVSVSFFAYDLENAPGSDDSLTPLVVQYRINETTDWLNVYYIADITRTVPGLPFIGVTVELPVNADNCPTLEVRIMTTNAPGNDEWVGIDNLTVQSLSAAEPVPPPQGAFVVSGGGDFVEGDSGFTPVTFTITRVGGSQGAVSVTYRMPTPDLIGGIGSGDFAPGTSFNGTLNFADGETSKTLIFNIKGDTDVESDESFSFALSNPTGGAVLGSPTGAVGKIINDDIQKPVISINDVTVTEGNTGTLTATFTITRTGGSVAFDVDYATANGTAMAGLDYVATSGTLHFDAGQNSRTVSVTVNGDSLVEADEYFFVNLTNMSFGTIADGEGRLTINNDDYQTLTGTTGNDIMDGLGGYNILIGLAGNDTYFVDDDEDEIREGPDEGYDAVYATAHYGLDSGAQVEWVSTYANYEDKAINLTGSDINQYLIGNQGANVLDGRGGADYMIGFAGDDTYIVDNFYDLIGGEGAGNGHDIVITRVSYILAAGWEIEELRGDGDGDINLTGNEFAQTLIGTRGNNILSGGAGADVMNGGLGSDTYFVDDAGDVIVEDSGTNIGMDAVYTTVSYALTAGARVEWLSTYATYETTAINLTGNSSGQYVVGNAGANVLDGKAGADILIGYGGADSFVFSTAIGGSTGNIDTIIDFQAGSDKILLDDAIFAALGGPGALAAGAFVTGTAAGDADDRIIYNSANGALYYDADGNGGGAAIHFATLSGAPVLAASDFQII